MSSERKSSGSEGVPWYKKVFGDDLIQWTTEGDAITSEGFCGYRIVPVENALIEQCSDQSARNPEYLEDSIAEVVGLYFPPLLGDDFTNRLVELYHKLNEVDADEASEDSKRKKRLQVVQVTTALTSSLGNGTIDHIQGKNLDVPWFAIPAEDFDRQKRLCRRFRVKADVAVATLLLIDGRSGRLITRAGRERLLADPQGSGFPWPPRPLQQVLEGAVLESGNRPGDLALCDLLTNNPKLIIGLYFSAHWCPPCKAFTPQLINTYQKLRERGLDFEVIFVSSDRSEESFRSYTAGMPWPSLPWREESRRQELASLLTVKAIPTLVLLEQQDGCLRVITDDGRALVNDDPDGKEFPWRPEAVNIFTERLSSRLHDHPAIILFVEGGSSEVEWAVDLLHAAADSYNKQLASDKFLAETSEPRLQFFVAVDGEASDSLREFLVLEDAVPLLVAVDVWRGSVSVLEDEDEDEATTITASGAIVFMEAFLAGDLPTAPIGVPLAPHPALFMDLTAKSPDKIALSIDTGSIQAST